MTDERINKETVKEALKEWLDEKILTFGKWSLMTIGAALLVAALYLIFSVEFRKFPL